MLRRQEIESSNRLQIEPLIHQWLKRRQELLVNFSQVFQSDRLPTPKLNRFCECLMDYLSMGHFQLFEKLAEAFQNTSNTGLDKTLLDEITKTTDHALDFNDKYTNPKDLTELLQDLSLLGENLSDRMDLEDKLIKDYWNLSSTLH